MKKGNTSPADDYLIRCPRLGHQVAFSYCRSENEGLPCFKTLDCWFEHFPVEEHLREDLTPEEWERAFHRPVRPKVQSLLELIEQAKKEKRPRTAGLILAAGSSTRMGTLKQLLDLGNHTLLDHVLSEALNSDLDRIVLVLGYQAQEIRKRLKAEPENNRLLIVENDRWNEGMSSSIKAGLAEVQEEYDHCMIILADMPHISANVVNQLLREYLLSGSPLGAIKAGDRRSLPAVFSRDLYNDLKQLEGDIGARELFLKYQDEVCMVEPEGYNAMDIDTPEDYSEFLKSLDDT
jgi:molybdenum cofactor cytidylyltransferase